MIVLDNLQVNEVVWQPGSFSASQDESGQWTATQTFGCRLQDVLNVVPKKGDSCTNDGWGDLKFNTSTVSEEAGSPWAMVTCIYKGATSDGDGSQFEDNISPTYNTSVVAQSEAIESHKNFKDLDAEAWAQIADYKSGEIFHDPEDVTAFKKKAYSESGEREEDEDVELSEDQVQLISALDKGFTSYYAPRTSFTARYTSNTQVKDSELGKVGQIASPSPTGSPWVSAQRKWLFMGVNSDNTGSVYDVEMEWLLSDDTGWDTDFYD